MILAKYQQKAKESETITELNQLLDLAITDIELTGPEYLQLLETVWARIDALANLEVAA